MLANLSVFVASTLALDEHAMADNQNCAICQDSFDQDEEETILPCLHKFHTYCVDAYMAVTHTDLGQLRCPACRLTPPECAARTSELLSTSAPESAAALDLTDHVAPTAPETVDFTNQSELPGTHETQLGDLNVETLVGVPGAAQRTYSQRLHRL